MHSTLAKSTVNLQILSNTALPCFVWTCFKAVFRAIDKQLAKTTAIEQMKVGVISDKPTVIKMASTSTENERFAVQCAFFMLGGAPTAHVVLSEGGNLGYKPKSHIPIGVIGTWRSIRSPPKALFRPHC